LVTLDRPGGELRASPPPADCAFNGTGLSGINALGVVAGWSAREDGVPHGFWRAANGSVSTFDAPGAVGGTFPVSINLWGQITGQAYDSSGVVHGFLLKP
jgi:hypothetical protein